MEYILGSLVTLVTIVVANKIITKKAAVYKTSGIAYTQSVVHEVLAPFLPTNKELRNTRINSQSSKHTKDNTMRVLFVSDKAYWIKNNVFYTADLVNGIVDEESTKKVDIMGMNDVQLKEMSFIVDKLTEGLDDENRYSGK